MKIKISEIECKFCKNEFAFDCGHWDFGTEYIESGCDCCSADVTIHVFVNCPHCNSSYDLEIK